MPTRLIVASVILVTLLLVGARPLYESARRTAHAVAVHFRAATGVVHLLALLAICAIGFWLRWRYYGVPMRWDESYTALVYGSVPLSRGISVYSANNHVFNTLLLHLSYLSFGPGARAIRAPAFIAGVLAPLVAYIAVLRLNGRHAALLAAALVAGAAQLVEYSTEARGYSLDTLAALVLVALAPSILRSRSVMPWVVFVVVGALGFYTVPVFLYPYAPIVGALAVGGAFGHSVRSSRRFLLMLIATVAATVGLAALLYGPISADIVNLVADSGYAAHPGAVGQALWRLWTLGYALPVKALVAVGFAASALSLGRRKTRAFPLAAMLVFLAIGVVVFRHVVTYTRVWLPLLALVLVCAAGSLLDWNMFKQYLLRRPVDIAFSLAAVVVALALFHVVSRNNLADQDYSTLPSAELITNVIAPRLKGPEFVVVTESAWPIAAWSFRARGLRCSDVDVGCAFVETTIGPQLTHDNYIVVNTLEGETLASVLATAAPQSGLKPTRGSKIASFPGAVVYDLHPPG